MNIPGITYKVIYNNKDITRDISDHLISISYTDKVEGESDEIEIEVEDKDALWQNEWFPLKGDTVEVQIIDNGTVLNCGKFTLDEKKFKSTRADGDVMIMSGLAASITKKLRTKKHTAHEKKTLRQLAQYVADAHGLTVQGTIPNITFSRITQKGETDLAFLNRIARQYGLLFSIRDSLLIFQDKRELESRAHVLSLDKTDVNEFEFLDKTENTYKDANVKYHNPEKNEVIEYNEADPDAEGYDTYTIRGKAENKQQAELQTKAALNNKNTRTLTCSVAARGNILLLSGNNVELTGFGKFSCISHITESKHLLNRSDGYTTSFEGKRVNIVPASKYKPKRIKSSRNNQVLTSAGGTAASVPNALSAGGELLTL